MDTAVVQEHHVFHKRFPQLVGHHSVAAIFNDHGRAGKFLNPRQSFNKDGCLFGGLGHITWCCSHVTLL